MSSDDDSDSSPSPQVFKFRHLEFKFLGDAVVPSGGGDGLAHMDLLVQLSRPTLSDPAVQFHHIAGIGRTAVIGVMLGLVLGVAIATTVLMSMFVETSDTTAMVVVWCKYLVFLCLYHLLEFVTTARYNPRIVTNDSFLIFQSKAYVIACVVSWVEFFVEAWMFPSLKGQGRISLVSTFGIFVVVVGQFFRSGAMITAEENFTHLISTDKKRTHRLVTTGLYQFLRHPSYFGWFWWSIGTQLLLRNPVCLVAYAIVAWKFFSDRIPYEEYTLTKFFPDEYPAYKARTRVGIPFIG